MDLPPRPGLLVKKAEVWVLAPSVLGIGLTWYSGTPHPRSEEHRLGLELWEVGTGEFRFHPRNSCSRQSQMFLLVPDVPNEEKNISLKRCCMFHSQNKQPRNINIT